MDASESSIYIKQTPLIRINFNSAFTQNFSQQTHNINKEMLTRISRSVKRLASLSLLIRSYTILSCNKK